MRMLLAVVTVAAAIFTLAAVVPSHAGARSDRAAIRTLATRVQNAAIRGDARRVCLLSTAALRRAFGNRDRTTGRRSGTCSVVVRRFLRGVGLGRGSWRRRLRDDPRARRIVITRVARRRARVVMPVYDLVFAARKTRAGWRLGRGGTLRL